MRKADLILIAGPSQIVSLNKRFPDLGEDIKGKMVLISEFLNPDDPLHDRDLPDIGEPFGNSPPRPFTAADLFELYKKVKPNLIGELGAVNKKYKNIEKSSSPLEHNPIVPLSFRYNPQYTRLKAVQAEDGQYALHLEKGKYLLKQEEILLEILNKASILTRGPSEFHIIIMKGNRYPHSDLHIIGVCSVNKDRRFSNFYSENAVFIHNYFFSEEISSEQRINIVFQALGKLAGKHDFSKGAGQEEFSSSPVIVDSVGHSSEDFTFCDEKSLIIVHVGTDDDGENSWGYEATKFAIYKLLGKGKFDNTYEFLRRGETRLFGGKRTATIEGHGKSYPISGLRGRIFVLTGGGLRECLYSAFKGGILAPIRRTLKEGGSVGRIEIHFPMGGIYKSGFGAINPKVNDPEFKRYRDFAGKYKNILNSELFFWEDTDALLGYLSSPSSPWNKSVPISSSPVRESFGSKTIYEMVIRDYRDAENKLSGLKIASQELEFLAQEGIVEVEGRKITYKRADQSLRVRCGIKDGLFLDGDARGWSEAGQKNISAEELFRQGLSVEVSSSAHVSSSPLKEQNDILRRTVEAATKPLIRGYHERVERQRQALNEGMTPKQAFEQEILPRLLKRYFANQEKGIPTLNALTGRGGCGKTTLENEYKERFKARTGLQIGDFFFDDYILPDYRRAIDFLTRKKTENPDEKFEASMFFADVKDFKQGIDVYKPLFDSKNRDRITLIAINKVKIMIKDGECILCLDLSETAAEPMLEFWGQEDERAYLGDRRKSFLLGKRAKASVKRDERGRIVLTIGDTGHIIEQKPGAVSVRVGEKETILKPGEWTDALQLMPAKGGIYFVDGILVLYDDELNLKYDDTIFLNVDPDVCFDRVLKRFEYETGRKITKEDFIKKRLILRETEEEPFIVPCLDKARVVITNHSRFESIFLRGREGRLGQPQFKPYLDQLGINVKELTMIMEEARNKITPDIEANSWQLRFIEQLVRDADIRFIVGLLQQIGKEQIDKDREFLRLVWLRLYLQTVRPTIPKYEAFYEFYNQVIAQPSLLREHTVEELIEKFIKPGDIIALDKRQFNYELDLGFRLISSWSYKQGSETLEKLKGVLEVARLIYKLKDRARQGADLLFSICEGKESRQAGCIDDLEVLLLTYRQMDKKIAEFKQNVELWAMKAKQCLDKEGKELREARNEIIKISLEVKSISFYLRERAMLMKYALEAIERFIEEHKAPQRIKQNIPFFKDIYRETDFVLNGLFERALRSSSPLAHRIISVISRLGEQGLYVGTRSIAKESGETAATVKRYVKNYPEIRLAIKQANNGVILIRKMRIEQAEQILKSQSKGLTITSLSEKSGLSIWIAKEYLKTDQRLKNAIEEEKDTLVKIISAIRINGGKSRGMNRGRIRPSFRQIARDAGVSHLTVLRYKKHPVVIAEMSKVHSPFETALGFIKTTFTLKGLTMDSLVKKMGITRQALWKDEETYSRIRQEMELRKKAIREHRFITKADPYETLACLTRVIAFRGSVPRLSELVADTRAKDARGSEEKIKRSLSRVIKCLKEINCGVNGIVMDFIRQQAFTNVYVRYQLCFEGRDIRKVNDRLNVLAISLIRLFYFQDELRCLLAKELFLLAEICPNLQRSRPIEDICGLGLSPTIYTYGRGVFPMLLDKSYQDILSSREQCKGLFSESDEKDIRKAAKEFQGINGRIISGGRWGIMPDSLNRPVFDSDRKDIDLFSSSPVLKGGLGNFTDQQFINRIVQPRLDQVVFLQHQKTKFRQYVLFSHPKLNFYIKELIKKNVIEDGSRKRVYLKSKDSSSPAGHSNIQDLTPSTREARSVSPYNEVFKNAVGSGGNGIYTEGLLNQYSGVKDGRLIFEPAYLWVKALEESNVCSILSYLLSPSVTISLAKLKDESNLDSARRELLDKIEELMYGLENNFITLDKTGRAAELTPEVLRRLKQITLEYDWDKLFELIEFYYEWKTLYVICAGTSEKSLLDIVKDTTGAREGLVKLLSAESAASPVGFSFESRVVSPESSLPFISSRLMTYILRLPGASSPVKDYVLITSKCGLISLDSIGASPSISTIITGWPDSFWARLTFSLQRLKSSLPLRWNTIWALSGIWSSVSGWLKRYLLNSAESVRCSSQKYSSFIIRDLLQKELAIYFPIFIQIFISISQGFTVVKGWHHRLFGLSAPMDGIAVSEVMSSIITDYRIPLFSHHHFQLDYEFNYFVLITVMLVAFSAIRRIGKNIAFDLNIHALNIYNSFEKVNNKIVKIKGSRPLHLAESRKDSSSPVSTRKSKSADRYQDFIGSLGLREENITSLPEAELRQPFRILKSINKGISIIGRSIKDVENIIGKVQLLRSRQGQGEFLSDEAINALINKIDRINARPGMGRGTMRIKREVIKPALKEVRERLLTGDLLVVAKLRVIKTALNQILNKLNMGRKRREAGLADKWKNYSAMGKEEMKPLSDFGTRKSLPRALKPFMPYAENISYKEEDGRVFLRVKVKDKDGKEKYAYLYLGLNDNLDKPLGGNERLFGLTLRKWRKLIDLNYNPAEIECKRPKRGEYSDWDDRIFRYEDEGVSRKLWAEYDNLIRLSIIQLIKKIDADNTGRLKKMFEGLFNELEITQPLSKKSWLGVSNRVFEENRQKQKSIPGTYWIIKNIIAGYLNKEYPKLFLGRINVIARPKKDLEFWFVTENPNMNASSLNWLVCAYGRAPPILYLKAEKISISRLRDLLASSSSSIVSRVTSRQKC
ncbi:MAG: hypothetical protein QME65_01080, partial [Candidatus Omnitrophota bacterium]|nr:hypothetical protein [Candidatus Omnitrophota bacterium]